jgi:tetratricopeptide (TPR) repeat protein
MQSTVFDDYPYLFRQMIGRAVTLALEEAVRPGWRPDPAQQTQLLFSLANALHLPATWSNVLPLLAVLAPRLEQAGMRAEWLAYLERGIACCDICGDQRTAAVLVLERGILLERLGQLAAAQTCLREAIDRFTALGDRRNLAKAHNRLAFTLRSSHAAVAQVHIEHARANLEPGDEEQLYCHLVLGIIAYDGHAWQEAEDHLQRCADGWRASENARFYGMSLINLSTVLMLTARNDQAIECLLEALPITQRLGDVANEALVHLNLGTAHLFLDQAGRAVPELLTAETMYRRLQDHQRLALVYSNLGLAYSELGRLQAAEPYFHAAIERFAALEDHSSYIDTLADLALLHLRNKQPARAQTAVEQAQASLALVPHAKAREQGAARLVEILAAIAAQ